jgi:hypothetical protein
MTLNINSGTSIRGNLSVNLQDIVKDGLVLHLDAGNTLSYPGTGNTWFDLSGNSYNHTLIGAGYVNISGVDSFNCSGTGRIRPISSTYTFTDNYTMIVWGNPLSISQVSSWRTLLRMSPNDHPLLINPIDDKMAYFDNNGGNDVYYSNVTLASLELANKFTMFVMSGSGGSTSLYYNAANFIGTVAYSATGNNHDTIGNEPTTGSQPFGYINSVYIYSRTLSISEILQNYQRQKSRFTL